MAALSLPSARAFFAFLITERLTTISELEQANEYEIFSILSIAHL